MKRGAFILAIDQGTTGSRAVLYDKQGRVEASAYQEFPQIFPKPGWVEHDPEKIWQSVSLVVNSVLQKVKNPSKKSIAAIGITNQRETTVLWSRKTGRPVHHAIVWQDRRTSSDCEVLRKRGYEKLFRNKTGLVLDPYFSGTKIAWLLNHVSGLGKKAERGEILFGTIDTWLLWKLTGGKVHATDPTNASRTLLFNIHTKRWDTQLLKILKIPKEILPKVLESGSKFGITVSHKKIPQGIPVHSILGDQQAALYGQGCYRAGQVKNTYGTGCFAVLNLGPKLIRVFPHGLLGTLACDEKGKPVYALEGSVFIGGAVIQWLRDGLKCIKSARETDVICRKVKTSGGVTFVPAFAGLGSPYWDPHARGMISGITRGTNASHIVRAAVESIAQQSADVVEFMIKAGARIREMKVDGGATHNNFLMQYQADLLRMPVQVASQSELTAWGTAKLAAKASGFWTHLKTIDSKITYRRFSPKMASKEASRAREIWKKEIQRVSL